MILPGAAALPPAMQLSLLLASNGPNFMDCRAAPLCGVLTLETGLGGGKYQHDQPVVHGLWPQVDSYGTSSCTAPRSVAKPTALAACYAPTAPSAEAALAFERYEWGKHGVCAGTVDAADYLDQLCSLAAAPLTEMSRARRAGLGLDETAASLRQAQPSQTRVTLQHLRVYIGARISYIHRRASRCGRSTRATHSSSSPHAQAPSTSSSCVSSRVVVPSCEGPCIAEPCSLRVVWRVIPSLLYYYYYSTGTDGRWKLAGVGEFDRACGGLTGARPPLPLPPTRESAGAGPLAPTASPPTRASGRADGGGATATACLPRERGPP